GCTLFECLTGSYAFKGETLSDVLASVLEGEPDWSRLPGSVPARLCELIERCLRKDAKRRLRDLGEARILLEELAAGTLPTEAPARTGRWPGGLLVPVLITMTVAAVGASFWSWNHWDSGPRRHLERLDPLTNTSVWTMGASWSPKGESIAYSEMTERGLDIFVKSVARDDLRCVVDGPGDDVAPRFSPTGRDLAYVSSSEKGFTLYLIEAGGGGDPRPLVTLGLSTLDLNSASYVLGDRPWLSNGNELLVSMKNQDGRMAIHRVDCREGVAKPLTFPGPGEADFSGSLSFDGEKIVFVRRNPGGADLWTMPAGGGEPRGLLIDKFGCNAPAWRPDNRHVVFIRTTRDSYYDAWEIDTKTLKERRITYETKRVWSLSVNEDDRIAMTTLDHDTFLYSVVRSGAAVLSQINSHTGDNFGARPALAGERIAYNSNRTGNPEIWTIDPLKGETQVTFGPWADLSPDWSPDGEHLVYVSNERGLNEVYVLDTVSLTRRVLVEDKPLMGVNSLNAPIFARWSPALTDQRIAFIVTEEQGNTLWTAKPDGSDLRPALSNVDGFDWYLDGTRGIISRQNGEVSEILAVDLENPNEQVLLWSGPHTEPEVAPDGTALSFCSGAGHMSMNVFVLELRLPVGAERLPSAVGEPVQRTTGEGAWHAHNGGWMSDSNALVFTRDQDYGDVYELIETE
ncbi:MAG: Tol biopolymer transport system component, partial [Candidatus Paceibacteria bacterium]